MSSLLAQTAKDYAVRLTTAVQANPPEISLSWPGDADVYYQSVSRKAFGAAAWETEIPLEPTATNFVDSAVSVGVSYEYRVCKMTYDHDGYGFVYAGIQVPLTESRGKVILVVDSSVAVNLEAELAVLERDLVGDGWAVMRHDVPRMAVEPGNTSSDGWAARLNELSNVKALIKADYTADPANVNSVFLIGHVPVPYSGDVYPDTHSNHKGAWPADVYYGDMDGVWTDSSVARTQASDTRNYNLPGDGKFDQTLIPSDIELAVGRVDFANLPAIPQRETELLRRYLVKDHGFRHQVFTVSRRGLIDDHFGLSTGEAFAANGWRDFAAFFGAAGTDTGDWLTTLSSRSYLWGYGCGAGTFTSCSGVASTSDYVSGDPRVVFSMLFGSYFGDWDSPNSLLRASLCAPAYTLTAAWAGRPFWFFHHMGLGETIGYSTRLSQNNNGSLYRGSEFRRFVHVALMGDPTLRMHVVGPPSGFNATADAARGVSLTWSPSVDSVVGYHVYRASTAMGPFTRLNSQLVAETSYTDSASTSCVYMVRAVKLETSGSGTYYNASQGVFVDYTPSVTLPVLTITAESTNTVYGAPLPTFGVSYSGFVNGDTAASLTSLPVLTSTATAESDVGSYAIHPSGAVASNYTFNYVDGTLTISRAATAGLVTSSANPALPGEPVSLSFAVSVVAPGGGMPVGSVQFKIDGTNAGSAVALTGGTAASVNSTMSHGLHTVSAEFADTTNHAGTTNTMLAGQLIDTPPVAKGYDAQRDPGGSVKVSIATLLSVSTDADGDTLSFVSADITSASGVAIVNGGPWLIYTPPLTFTNVDSFTYVIMDSLGLMATGTVTVAMREILGPSPNLTLTDLGGFSFSICGDGIPGRVYRIEYAEVPLGSTWRTLGVAITDENGVFVYIDTGVSSQRYYRSAYP